ncbi:MAG: hypothetical protein AAF226_13905 [Verrucomicrobiota bacterium]
MAEILQNRNSECNTRSREEEVEKLRAMTVEQRVLLALNLEEEFAWAIPDSDGNGNEGAGQSTGS